MLHAAFAALLALASSEPAPIQDASEVAMNPLVTAKQIKVADLLESPKEYLGQTLRVEGIVVDTGDKPGRWLAIANDPGEPSIRITFEQGAAELPNSTKGFKVAVEGVFLKVKRAPDDAADGNGVEDASTRGGSYEIRTKRVSFEKMK